MARSITVILTANAAPLITELNKAGAATASWEKKTTAAGTSIDRSMQKAATAAEKYGKSTAWVDSHSRQINTLSNGLAGIGVAAGLAFGAAVKSAADFDQEMSKVQAAQGGSAANMDALRKAAIEWGQKTQFSATEAAAGITELEKAGVSAQDVLGGGLQGALNLAAAGQISVAEAAEDAASAMTQFGLQGKDVPHIADLLAAAAGKAQGEVGDMATALKYVGPVAAQMGVSIEQTSGAIAELAANGIKGDQAGTGLRGMLSSLTSPSKMAAAEMSRLGINVYDAQGKFVGFDGVAGQLQTSLGHLTNAERDHALGVLFGNEQITAARILYKGGAEAVDAWTKKVNDAGFASRTAATKMDNLKGDLEQLRGSFETALIGAGEGQQAPLRDFIQAITDLVNKWNELDDSTKSTVIRIVGGIGAIALAGAGLGKLVTAIATVKMAFVDLGVTAKLSGSQVAAGADTGAAGMSKLQKAAGGVAAGIIAFQAAGAIVSQFARTANPELTDVETTLLRLSTSSKGAGDALGNVFHISGGTGDWFGPTKDIDDLSGALDRLFNRRADTKVNDAFTGFLSKLGLAKGQFEILTDESKKLDGALTQMAQGGQTDQAAAAFGKIADQARKQGVSMTDLLTIFPSYKAALQQQANDLGVTSLKAADYANWMGGKVPPAVQRASAAISQSSHATDRQKAAADAAGAANLKLVASSNVLKDNLTGLGVNTDKLTTSDDLLSAAMKQIGVQTDKLISGFTVLNQGAIDADQATDAWKGSLHALSRAVKDNGKSLDNNTEKGRANKDAIRSSIGAMNAKISADFKAEAQTKGVDKATQNASKSLRTQKQNLIDTAVKAGFNRREVKKMVDQMVLTPKELRTQVKSYGIDGLKKQIKDLQRQIDDLAGTHNVTLDYRVLSSGKAIKLGQAVDVGRGGHNVAGGFATGGYVAGPGTGTSDSIMARLSNGEFVIKNASVQKLGLDRLNFMNQTGHLPAFRDGGLVNSGPLNSGPNGALGAPVVPVVSVDGNIAAGAVNAIIGSIASTTESINLAAQSVLQSIVQGMAGTGLIGNGRFEKALNFARSQEGKPYVWAAAGPGGYDCSGFMGAIQNVIEGKHPYSRRWSTQAFQGQENAQGYTKNASSAFQIGVTNAGVGHTAGTLNGVNVESRGGAGVLVGPEARGASDALFGMHYGLTSGMAGKAGIAGGAGATERVSGSAQQVFRKLMLIAGYPASAWSMVDYIIGHESGWNVHATNPSSGAYGLPQAYPGSKMAAYGPDWRNSAATQGNFFFDYVNKYGGLRGAYEFWRANNWYADGGFVSGAGGPRDDKVPAMLSNGEFVMNAAATSAFRPLLEQINSGVSHFASGGAVGSFGASGSFSVAAIVKLIREANYPTADLAKFTAQVKRATLANSQYSKAAERAKVPFDRAARAYDRAKSSRDDLRLLNARQVKNARDDVASAGSRLDAAKIRLDKLKPEGSKAAAAQSALVSAQNSRDSKAKANAEQIAKYNDQIAQAKKGTLAYQNLINRRELAQKANHREMVAADDKVTKARKAADKAGVNTTKVARAQAAVTKAQNVLDRARDKQAKVTRNNTLQMAEANNKVTKALAAKKKAQESYDRVADKSKAKTDALKQAQQELAEQQKAVADAALQVSSAFTDAYLSKSTAVADWLQSMSVGTKDITDLTTRIAKLRKLGLSETLIQQIIGMAQSSGAPAGQAIADAIIAGGDKTVKKLNDAAGSLQDAADVLGYKSATGKGRYATGGYVMGSGTGTSDSINARLSNGEYVINSVATARNRALLDQINYGVPGFAMGGYVSSGGGSNITKRELVSLVAAVVDSRPMIGQLTTRDSSDLVEQLNLDRRRKMQRTGWGSRR